MNSAFIDFYRCPESFAEFTLLESPSKSLGYFRFGPDAICYGKCAGIVPAWRVGDELYDTLGDVVQSETGVGLPFDPTEIVTNLRYERYVSNDDGADLWAAQRSIQREIYYLLRPLLPVAVRKHLQRMNLKAWKEIPFPSWPVDRTVECIFERLMTLLLEGLPVKKIPFIWFWPDGLPSCCIVTHDVETSIGRDFCSELMDLEDAYGIKSSFQVIPERRYDVTPTFLEGIRRRGFEVNVHDLNHDGRLFENREQFLIRAQRINQIAKEYAASGFRSGALYRNLEWFENLNFSYDMSVPSVGHLEAQRGGCCSLMPFFIGKILELPVTAVQDYTLFHILKDYSTEIWDCQLERILGKYGMASFIVHPDYVYQARALNTYSLLLRRLAGLRTEGKTWLALPGEVNQWWRARSQMKLVCRGDEWVIEGPESGRAQIAYAVLDGGQLTYELEHRRQRRISQPEERSSVVVLTPAGPSA